MQPHPTVKIKEIDPIGVKPFQPIYKAGGLIDLTFNHPASNGTLGLNMPNILCPMYREGQGELCWNTRSTKGTG